VIPGASAEAAGAFRRALEAYPSVHQATDGFGLRRLSRVLFTEPSYYRVGYRLTPDTVWYGAFPSFDHDSVAFVPYPLADVLGAKGDANPATTGAAVAYARDVLGSVTTVWLRAFPRSPERRLELCAMLREHRCILLVAKRLVGIDQDLRVRHHAGANDALSKELRSEEKEDRRHDCGADHAACNRRSDPSGRRPC